MRLTFNHHSSLLNRDVSPYLNQLWKLIEESDFIGYDPGSLRSEQAERYLLNSQHTLALKWNNYFSKLLQFSGYTGVKLLNLPKISSTKALALCASGFAELFCMYPKPEFKIKGGELLERLERRRDANLRLWKVDFTYRVHGNLVSSTQPGLINSIFAADAFWKWYEITQDIRWGSIFLETINHLLKHISRLESTEDCCFTYNPSVKYYVHNANMLMAALLVRASHLEGGNAMYDTLVNKCVNYTLKDISRTNSVPYAGPPTPNGSVDNYHTGYILRSLSVIRRFLPKCVDIEKIEVALSFTLNFYLDHFVDRSGIYRTRLKNRIQTHSLAESIIIYTDFWTVAPDRFGEQYSKATQITFDLLWDKRRKYFVNEIYKLPMGLIRYDVTPMVRWSWSWMFYALIKLVVHEIKVDLS